MEDLFKNFSEHVGKMISPKLENEIKLYLSRKLAENPNADDYSEIENDIKNIMAIYFQGATDKDYLEISTNLFNAYVDYDDKNLIRAIKYFIRVYSYFQELNMHQKFYHWRINALKRRVAEAQGDLGQSMGNDMNQNLNANAMANVNYFRQRNQRSMSPAMNRSTKSKK